MSAHWCVVGLVDLAVTGFAVLLAWAAGVQRGRVLEREDVVGKILRRSSTERSREAIVALLNMSREINNGKRVEGGDPE